MSSLRIAALTSAALVGFAANSLLCRLALAPRAIDAATFTTVRLVAGTITLEVLVRAGLPAGERRGGTWGGAAALFGYAIAFSLAYTQLGAGPGALILFGAVQLTMLGAGIASGERPRALEWAGLAVAASGLVALTFPGLTAPDPIGAALMAAAGVAWGVYSVRGRGSAGRPLAATAGNFLRSVPFAAAASLVALGDLHASPRGLALATASGAIASGVGYSLWYAALKGLTATRAAVVQLSVPVLAAAGGVWVLDEALTVRLGASGLAILGGIALALLGRQRAVSDGR